MRKLSDMNEIFLDCSSIFCSNYYFYGCYFFLLQKNSFSTVIFLEIKILFTKLLTLKVVARRQSTSNKPTEILYEAPELLVSGSALGLLTSLPGVKAYSVLICWNSGVNFFEDTRTFKSAFSFFLQLTEVLSRNADIAWPC